MTNANIRQDEVPDRLARIHEQIAAACARSGRNPSEVQLIGVSKRQPPERIALAWLLKNPIVTAPIMGPRTIEQLRDCLNVLPVKLDDDVWKTVEEIWPGPGGEAPEAYSW